VDFKYLPHHNQGIRTGDTFEERVGAPTVVAAALGYAVWHFSVLEDAIDYHIAQLSGADDRASTIMLAELSFRSKVSILSALVRETVSAGRLIKVGEADPLEHFRELTVLCQRAEELRNGLMHSRWEGAPSSAQLTRRKTTIKPRRGLHTASEVLTGDHIMDIGDFFALLSEELSEFFIPYGAGSQLKPGR